MNKKIKFAIIGLILAVLILAIINFQLHMRLQREIIKPPSAILKADGKEQISGIGSYCWNEVTSSVCADYMGIPTSDEPLPVSSPFTVHLSLPFKEPPQELQINVIRVTDNDKIKSRLNGSLLWQVRGENLYKGNYSNLTPESESNINLSLEPGLFVLKVYPSWKEKGSVSYGFLVEVRANDTGAVSTKVQGVKITGDIGASIGYSGENQTDSQKISWTVSIANTGAKTAKNVTAYVILPPGIVSRLDALEESIALGNLEPEGWAGFKGNATFNASGLSKQDIMAWEPLVKIKVTWTEDGKVNEKLLPDEVNK